MINGIVCDRCGQVTEYDRENTLYLKCPNCSRILIDRKIDDDTGDPLIVVDYGIKDGVIWVQVENEDGRIYTYYKSRKNFRKVVDN